MPDLVLESIKRQLTYDPETGLFHWLVNKLSRGGKVKIGVIAGTPKDDYIQIKVDGRLYRAHRLAYYMMTGKFPPKGFELDHIDRNGNNNKWSNLRVVTRTGNNFNQNLRIDNKSGCKGVRLPPNRTTWEVRIAVKGKLIIRSGFATKELAIEARKQLEAEFMTI